MAEREDRAGLNPGAELHDLHERVPVDAVAADSARRLTGLPADRRLTVVLRNFSAIDTEHVLSWQ